MMVCCEKDVTEETNIEYKRVMAISMTPDTHVSNVSFAVLIRGEEGLGKEARAEPLTMYES